MKSADDAQPMRGFSHRCPLGSTSQSISQCDAFQFPDCVAVFVGL